MPPNDVKLQPTGYVAQMAEAYRVVERTASEHTPRWDVKEAFLENLKNFREEP